MNQFLLRGAVLADSKLYFLEQNQYRHLEQSNRGKEKQGRIQSKRGQMDN